MIYGGEAPPLLGWQCSSCGRDGGNGAGGYSACCNALEEKATNVEAKALAAWEASTVVVTGYDCALLDPRNIPAAIEANEKVFAGSPVFGVEVTVPALAERCVANLDPQHSGGDANRAAIEDALTIELPGEGSTLATVRADLDAVGSMAVLNIRAKRIDLKPAMERIALVATSDKFAHGGWPGSKLLPTRDNPWIEEMTTAESSRELAVIAATVMDFKIPLANRVSTMERWLLTGEELEHYRAQVVTERLDMIAAIENGAIKYSVKKVSSRVEAAGAMLPDDPFRDVDVSNCIAVVESRHRAATSVGYSLAPVVVAMNPAFKQGAGEPYKKFTVCQFTEGFVDMKSFLAELNELESGWGGSPTIIGSPQGVSSILMIDRVVEVLEKHLLR
jgi:hypothetical protein